jgi:lysine-specific demethylase/histidyl-hydroxylase NO66
MNSLDELLHPITPDRFMAEYYGRKPLHIPAEAGAPKAGLIRWPEFNGLLGQVAAWTPQTLRLVRDGHPMAAEYYCDEVDSQNGKTLRPNPAKVEIFLSTGASLVANDVQTMTPNLRDLSTMLGTAFKAKIGANAYCSFGGVRAFATHFDLHDVFAVQVEGEKMWRIYEGQADRPVAYPLPDDQVKPWFEQTRGRPIADIIMRPGDVLYLPRGRYHDALAQPGASLHVTYSVTPLYGRIIFGLLEQAAMNDPDFRTWLEPADRDDGRPLRDQLAALGRKLAEMAALPAFAEDIAMTQQKLIDRPSTYDLPRRKPLTGFRPTGLAGPPFTGQEAIVMGWAFGQPDFALEDLCAQFTFVDPARIHKAVEAALGSGALSRI